MPHHQTTGDSRNSDYYPLWRSYKCLAPLATINEHLLVKKYVLAPSKSICQVNYASDYSQVNLSLPCQLYWGRRLYSDSRRRTKLKPIEIGNNRFGRKGTLKCYQCRKWRIKVRLQFPE